MNQASAFYHGDGALETSTPFCQEFVSALKCLVPPSHRTWNPEARTWLVEHPYDSTAFRLLHRHFPHVDVREKPGRHSSTGKSRGPAYDDDYKMLSVRQDAPVEVVQAAYRALVKIHHPDRGGDTVAMQRLNAAFARLESGAKA